MEVWKIIFLSKWVICRFHVNLPGRNATLIPPQEIAGLFFGIDDSGTIMVNNPLIRS